MITKGNKILRPNALEIIYRHGFYYDLKEQESIENLFATSLISEDKISHLNNIDVTRAPIRDAKILIAEDIKLSQKLLVNILNQHHIYKIIIVDDGASAVRKFIGEYFDIIFLDIDMPIMDGIQALSEIKALDPKAFVCLVSSNSTLINVNKAKELGVNGFLVKSISGLNIKRILNMYEKISNNYLI